MGWSWQLQGRRKEETEKKKKKKKEKRDYTILSQVTVISSGWVEAELKRNVRATVVAA
jgi:hypothetical protein